MAKKVIKLTESELSHIIHEVTEKALNEIGGKTLSIPLNVANNARNQIQQGNLKTKKQKPHGEIEVDYNDEKLRANRIFREALKLFKERYIGDKFLFWADTRLGEPISLVFTLKDIVKLLDNKLIISGDMILEYEMIGEHNIEVNLATNRCFCKYRGYSYNIEPNTTTKPKWDAFITEIKNHLMSRIRRGM